MLTISDKVVIAFYFLFMVAIAWIFKRFVRNTSDYFRGGGEMLWWLAGAGAFTVGFSAITFTGMAGRAFTDGPVVIVIFLGNAVGFLGNYFWFAPTCRQTRAVTSMQVVRARFGRFSEQFFMWLQIPVALLSAGLHLTGLCVFVSAAFGFPLQSTIIATGTVVLIMALLGGSWSVMAGDFVQMLVLMPVTVVAAALSIHYVGGVKTFVDSAPSHFWHWGETANSNLVILWVIATLLQKYVSNNSMQDSTRYLSVKDSKNARKAALLGFVMFLIGPAVWFIPPMCARIAAPDLAKLFPTLEGAKVNDAAYFAMAHLALPAGMTGLVLSVIFGATMSSVDGGLNKNAGFFVKNFYQPFINPKATERRLLVVSKGATILFGGLIICSALLNARFKNLSLFEMTTYLGGMVSLPVAIPLVLGLMFRRAPSWAGWTTVLVGLATSIIVSLALSAKKFQVLFNFPLNPTEVYYYTFLSSTFAIIVVQCIYYTAVTQLAPLRQPSKAELASFPPALSIADVFKPAAPKSVIAITPQDASLSYASGTTPSAADLVAGGQNRPPQGVDAPEFSEPIRVARFAELIKTPVDFDREETGGGSDNAQAKVMGILSLIYGMFVSSLAALPNATVGRLAFLFCGGTMLIIGTLLYRAGTKASRTARKHKIIEPSDPATIPL